MFASVGTRFSGGWLRSAVMALCGTAIVAGTAAAQSTVLLNQPYTHVTDTTLRNGAYARTTHDRTETLTTRRSSDPDWERRAILKFDTQNFIPQGARIASATLTLTVKAGLGSGTRPIQLFRVTQPFQEAEATWMRRQGDSNWRSPGGDVDGQFSAGYPSATAGSKVTFDVTQLVQRTVNGEFDSRYTRVLLADSGSDVKESLRDYYASEEDTVSRRPTLTVVLGSAAAAPAPAPAPRPQAPSASSGTLKVLQWNIQQGRQTTGGSNIDRVVSFIVQNRPDVISLNEVLRYSGNDQARTIADKLRAQTGDAWYHYWVEITGQSQGIGVAVLSRIPFDSTARELLAYGRSAALVSFVVNGRRINFTSTHLDHQSSSRRLAQVREVKGWLNGFAQERIVAGDFNWYPGTTEIVEMAQAYYDSWDVADDRNLAVSTPGNPDGNTRNTRIDYIWYSRQASNLTVTRSQVFERGTMSDHRPLITTFRVE